MLYRYEAMDPRLGRHVNHDPRALRYPVGVLPRSAIQSVHWAREVPIFDQGNLGSCTGNAGTGLLGTDNSGQHGNSSVMISDAGAAASHGHFTAGTRILDESFAVDLYSLATDIDSYPGEYPPDDTGSDGPSVAAALVLLGLASSYSHAFSIDALKSAIQSGPVMWGTEWLNSMFNPNGDGTLPVDPNSGVAGGHELVISGYDPSSDVFSVDNSWGTSWGLNGSCFVSGTDMAYLLGQQGDITVPNYAIVPVPPVPVPPGPPVPPTPGPVTFTGTLTGTGTFTITPAGA